MAINSKIVTTTKANSTPAGFVKEIKKPAVNTQTTLPALANQKAEVSIKAKAPENNLTIPTNKLEPGQAKPMSSTPPSFTSEQDKGLNAAFQRRTGGSSNAEDVKNLSYAESKGWKPSNGAATAPTSPNNAYNPDLGTNIPKQPDTTSKGILTSLVGAGMAGSESAKTAQTGLINSAQQNMGTSGQAYLDYQTAVNELNALKSKMAEQTAGISSTGIPLEFQQGRQQVLNQQYASQLDAAQQKVNQAQAALGYQLQGVGLQQAGLNQAGTLGQTGQGLTQSALSSAAGFAQPVQVPYGTPLVTPQTGEIVGGGGTTAGGVTPDNPFYQTLKSYAQLLATNQGAAIPSSITGNSVLNAQLIQMAKQINPAFNVNVATGAAGAQTGTAGTQATQIQAYTSALQQGQNLQNQVTDLITKFGLNPADINKANQGLQVIAANVSDPRYKVLQNYINDIANTYAQILTPAGGSQTDTTRGIASSMLDSSMKGSGIISVMKSLDEAAKAKIAGIPTSGGLGGNIPSGSSLYDF